MPVPEEQALPIASAADIAQLYDAYANLPKPDPNDPNPTPVAPDPANTPAGAVPAALEFDGLHGRIIVPLDAVPSEALHTHPLVMELVPDGIQSIKLDEQEDGDWCITLQGEDIHGGARFALPLAEMQAMLARDGVSLYGRPSEEEIAAMRAAKAAPEETEAAAEDTATVAPF